MRHCIAWREVEIAPVGPLPAEIEALLDRLRRAGILYRVAPESACNGVIHVTVRGERWEIEYFPSAPMEVEVFVSDGEVQGKAALKRLFDVHGDASLKSPP